MRRGNELIILGQTFHSNYFSVYDFDNRRVGLAKAVHPTTAPDFKLR